MPRILRRILETCNFFEMRFHFRRKTSKTMYFHIERHFPLTFGAVMQKKKSSVTRPRGRPKAFYDKTDQNTVQALDRGLRLLSLLSMKPGLSLSEIADESGQAVSTVFRVLTTLQGHALVEVEEPGQFWHVGSGAFRIGTAFLRRTKVVERARQPMDVLMRETGETANLGIEAGDEVLFLGQVETHQMIRAFFPPGTKAPMHVSGIGKALLAWYPEEKVRHILRRSGMASFTDNSHITEASLLQDLVEIRSRGFAIDNEERAVGMRCIAAPIFNSYSEPIAGLSISGPAFRMEMKDSHMIGRLVMEAATRVTGATGGVVPQSI